MEETGPEAGGNMTCPRYKQHETQSDHGRPDTVSDKQQMSKHCLDNKVNIHL